MNSGQQTISPVSLSDRELADSLPYVCYERTMYHYLQRRLRVERFPWMLLDRLFHTVYVPGVNEAIQYRGDGFSELQARHEVVEVSTRDSMVTSMRDRMAEGWLAHAMMETRRPDGSAYWTSTLVEGILGDIVYLTKTNETMRETSVPTAMADFLARLPDCGEAECQLTFIRFDEALVEELQSRDGLDLLRLVHRDLYGYEDRAGTLLRKGSAAELGPTGFRQLRDYLAERLASAPEEIVSDKGLQLMMNKHVGNKVRPLTRAWQNVLPIIQELAADGGPLGSRDDALFVRCDHALADIEKWFVLASRRPGGLFLDRYLGALDALDLALIDLRRECLAPFLRMVGEA